MIPIVILLNIAIGLLISIVVKLDKLIALFKKIADSEIVVKADENER